LPAQHCLQRQPAPVGVFHAAALPANSLCARAAAPVFLQTVIILVLILIFNSSLSFILVLVSCKQHDCLISSKPAPAVFCFYHR